jgi:hypothetical protein
VARSCDQYRGGCPRASDGVWESQIICTGNDDSLMDCGGAAPTVTAFDYETFVTAYHPSTPFLQRQAPPPPPCNPCWDNGFWRFSDGWALHWDSKVWFTPFGWAEWGECTDFGCWHIPSGRWISYGSSLYSPNFDLWSSPPQ